MRSRNDNFYRFMNERKKRKWRFKEDCFLKLQFGMFIVLPGSQTGKD